MATKNTPKGLYPSLWNLGIRIIRELESDRGILASGKNEVYGCIFGRDSLITALSLIDVYEKTKDTYYLELVRKILINIADLQGRVENIESGEEPGKIIHEYRPDNHEHLTGIANGNQSKKNSTRGAEKAASETYKMYDEDDAEAPQRSSGSFLAGSKPWYVYGDNIMRNYDSVDSTPLFLLTVHAYLRSTGERDFVESLLPNVRAALSWISDYGDSNGDGLIDYRFHSDRNFGGLQTQSWMDSTESVFFEESEERPQYPIAPVEAQAYVYAALMAWADYYAGRDAGFSLDLSVHAGALRKKFNVSYIVKEQRGRTSLAFAIDGRGRQLVSARSSMGHCLWAVWHSESGAMPDSILDSELVPAIARRLLTPDLYIPRAGIRTLSVRSRRYDANSYHNGSIWPHDTAMIAKGLDNFGFREEAKRVRRGLVSAYAHFNTPLELFVYNRGYKEYCDEKGQGACRTQAWSAASLLSIVHQESELGL